MCGTLQHNELYCKLRPRTVHLPFKPEARPSNSFQTAKQKFLERKRKDHDDVKQQNRDFIKEVMDMGRPEQALQTSDLCYYLPHHTVCSRIERRPSFVSCLIPAASLRMAIL